MYIALKHAETERDYRRPSAMTEGIVLRIPYASFDRLLERLQLWGIIRVGTRIVKL